MIVFVLEGPDSCGKTLHADALAMSLRERGISARSFHHARPPQGTGPYEAALHYVAERIRLLRRTQCDVIVADRWHTSTSVLATALRRTGASLDTVRALETLSASEDLGYAGVTLREILLTAPDDVLDARLAARGTPVTELDRAIRAAYGRIAAPRVTTEGPREEIAATLLDVAVRVVATGCGVGEAVRAVRRGDPAESLAILADGSGHEEAAEAAEGTEP